MKDYTREAKKISDELKRSTGYPEGKTVKLNAMIDLAVDIESCGLIRSEEAAVEIRDDLVDIHLSTGQARSD